MTFAGQHAMQPQLSSLYSNDNLFFCRTALFLSLPAARARLSLVHIEYLYSRWLGSRSLISKVTCRSLRGGCWCAGVGLGWSHMGHIVSSVCPFIPLRQRIRFSGRMPTTSTEERRVNELLEWGSYGQTIIWFISKNTSSLSIKIRTRI